MLIGSTQRKRESMETTERAVQVGDFFEESWGYDQTNVNFYQVTRISASGKSVWLREVQQAVVSSEHCGRVAPLPDTFRDGSRSHLVGEFRRTLKRGWQGAPWVNLTSYSGASLWDGTPAYDTIAAEEPGH